MEVVLFRVQKTIIKKNMNFRISGQKINILKETKYLGMTMDEHLTFKNHMDTVKLKLNRANKLLAKLRHFVNPTLLRTIYYAIFEPYLRYGCQLWVQAQTQILQNIEKIQNKSLRVLNFENPWEPKEQIYKESKIFKLKYIVTISNLKFVYDQMNKILPRVFEKIFINKTRKNLYNTRRNSLDVPQVKTTTYGSNSFTLHAIRTRNFFQNKLSTTTLLPNLTPTKFLKVIKIYISEKV